MVENESRQAKALADKRALAGFNENALYRHGMLAYFAASATRTAGRPAITAARLKPSLQTARPSAR